jgi:formylglycine-generating enzyme required for sulfatase activity
VIRGGHWNSGARGVRSADRGSGLPNGMNDDLGFRLVREK